MFIPTAENGTVEVTFVVDTYQLQDMEIVVFESLFAGFVTGSTLESDVPKCRYLHYTLLFK
ncbi:MAG: VaFE repeat-containing surface-anchored protein [Lachnospiraceae bacterium]|nr:VaFE repeat-containing surface-anchored protein [Lachnospiraceae bacterium]